MADRLIIGMSGASGAPLTVELLRQLHAFYPQVETHLVVTKGGEMTLREETDLTLQNLKAMASVYYENDNIGAAIASGSFHTMGMAVVPCSMKTVAGIVSGYSDNLLLRAADVCMKEHHKLVLVPREAPFSTLHLRNLYEASQLGAVILPPMQTYYNHPQTVEDMTRHTVERILSQFGLETQLHEWVGMEKNLTAETEKSKEEVHRFMVRRTLMNEFLTADILILPLGVEVTIYGGSLPHIGAVSIVDPDGNLTTTQFPTHKDGVVSGRWARVIADAGHLPVTVVAGIHYDHLTKEEIAAVVEMTDEMLEEVLEKI